MEPFVTMGLVLKETRYREADRILTILTPKLGVITAMAANSLRLKSKLFSACGLFCYSEFTLVPGRNMYTVREADVQNIFHGISSSIEGVSLAMYLTELAAALSPTGEEAARELRLVLNSHICLVEDKKIFAFKISVGSLAKLSAVAENYALTHLDKPLKSYAFLKSVLP